MILFGRSVRCRSNSQSLAALELFGGSSGFTRARRLAYDSRARCRSGDHPTAPSGDTWSTRSLPNNTLSHIPPNSKHFQHGTRRIICVGLLSLTNQTGSTELRRHPDVARCTFTKATPLLVSTPNHAGLMRIFARSERILAFMHDIDAVTQA
jgi:hypothetical protein